MKLQVIEAAVQLLVMLEVKAQGVAVQTSKRRVGDGADREAGQEM